MALTPKPKKTATAKPKAKGKVVGVKKLPWETFERNIPVRSARPQKVASKGSRSQVITKVVYVPAGQYVKAKGGQNGKSAGKGFKKFGKAAGKGKMVKSKFGKFSKGVARKVSNTVSKDKEIDKEARYTGTVVSYHKMKGCGFIKADDENIVNENLFVYWKSIKSDDRFPSLQKDMQVEFGLAKKKGFNGKLSLVAKQVSLPGGGNIAIQDDVDAQKEFVGGKDARYTGHLKFFDPMNGFGYINVDKTDKLGDDVPKQLRVETAEVNAGGRNPRRMKDMKVEFGIWKTKKDKHKAYNMTAPGGDPLTEELASKRKVIEGETLEGKIVIYNFKGNWGYIAPKGELPQQAKKKMAQQNKVTREKGKEVKHKNAVFFKRFDCQKSFKPEKDAAVTFQIYTDERGVGACEIGPA